jgi:sulfide dehydrogenase cytochrome subunit
MNSQTPVRLLLILFLFSLPKTVILATEISQGAMLANSCAACHGTFGKSPGAIPAINGKKADFIVQSLMDFRSGTRPSTVMGRHAKGYTDKEIQLIAEYFSSL